MSMVKKLIALGMVLSLVSVSVGVTESDAATVRRGKIVFYDALGRTGSDGKVMTQYDCAVGYLYKNTIPKGTPIYTSNEDKQKFVTLYKWDWGNFNDPVILDVTKQAYLYNLGGVIDAQGGGWIPNGRISY
jgi:hypothetical protein